MPLYIFTMQPLSKKKELFLAGTHFIKRTSSKKGTAVLSAIFCRLSHNKLWPVHAWVEIYAYGIAIPISSKSNYEGIIKAFIPLIGVNGAL